MTVTAFDTFEKFIGSGALGFPWYRVDQHPADNIDADTWTLAFTELDFGASDIAISQHAITHTDLMRTVLTLATADGADLANDTVRTSATHWFSRARTRCTSMPSRPIR